jgi:hypothetical protein
MEKQQVITKVLMLQQKAAQSGIRFMVSGAESVFSSTPTQALSTSSR